LAEETVAVQELDVAKEPIETLGNAKAMAKVWVLETVEAKLTIELLIMAIK
jgi:hypothetical protein